MVDYNNVMDYMEQMDPDELIEVMNWSDVQKNENRIWTNSVISCI